MENNLRFSLPAFLPVFILSIFISNNLKACANSAENSLQHGYDDSISAFILKYDENNQAKTVMGAESNNAKYPCSFNSTEQADSLDGIFRIYVYDALSKNLTRTATSYHHNTAHPSSAKTA